MGNRLDQGRSPVGEGGGIEPCLDRSFTAPRFGQVVRPRLGDNRLDVGPPLQEVGDPPMHPAAVALHHRFVGDPLQQGMPEFVGVLRGIVLAAQDLRLDQRFERFDDPCIAIAEQLAEEGRAERSSDAGRGLDDPSAAIEPVKPLGHDFRQGQRQIVGGPTSAGLALTDQRERHLLDEERDAVAIGRRLRQKLVGNRLGAGNRTSPGAGTPPRRS